MEKPEWKWFSPGGRGPAGDEFASRFVCVFLCIPRFELNWEPLEETSVREISWYREVPGAVLRFSTRILTKYVSELHVFIQHVMSFDMCMLILYVRSWILIKRVSACKQKT